MIKSMTGFGHCEMCDRTIRIIVEMKSVNHRYLDLNLKMPNLEWTSEIVPIKQGGPILITLFGSWIIAIVVVVLYLLFGWIAGPVVYLAVFAAVMALICVLLYRWIVTRGAAVFEDL